MTPRRQELIDQILQHRQAMAAKEQESAVSSEKERSADDTLGHIADMLDAHAELLTRNTQTVRVQNHPKTLKLDGPVSLAESDELLGGLEDLENAFDAAITSLQNSLVEAINQDREVTVKNQVTIPTVEIPKQVKSEIVSLPKYVSEGLDAIRRAVNAQDLKVTVQPTPVVVEPVDLSTLESRLSALEGLLSQLLVKETPEPEPLDLGPLRQGLDEIATGIQQVRDNTSMVTSPTYRSDWDKSFEVRRQDYATHNEYITHSPSGLKVLSYIEVTEPNGDVYRKTFSFDTDGDTIDATGWIKQAPSFNPVIIRGFRSTKLLTRGYAGTVVAPPAGPSDGDALGLLLALTYSSTAPTPPSGPSDGDAMGMLLGLTYSSSAPTPPSTTGTPTGLLLSLTNP